MSRSRWLIALVLGTLVLGTLAAVPSDALKAGQYDGDVYGGCGSTALGSGCHSTAPASEVSVGLTGFPPAYDPLKTYTVTITVDGPAPTGDASEGGFFLGASGGKFSIPSTMEGKAWTFKDDRVVTHRDAGNDQRTWTVYWQAPETGDVTVTAYGNAVNGDDTNSDADVWGEQTLTITGPGGAESNGAPAPGLLLAGLALALLAIARRER